ncbi:MAG: hypothetical protein IPM42_08020 [Saprospiraceae bacterium]|nr:hypothetical protein [Saprospiraceae bacterium]
MTVIITTVVLILSGLWLKTKLFSSNKPTRTVEFVHGPFTIRMEQFITSEFNMNYGKYYKRSHISYSVWHEGKLVSYPAELQTNTGFSHLWRVYIVKDAPQPTLFAGSQNLFMITAKDETYEVEKLDVRTSDFISFQWLDAVNGQPAPAFELYMGNEGTSMEHPDTLQGGNYLMISQKLVVYIPTMEMNYFDKEGKYIDNYHKNGSALAFSPDKKVIVFPGNFSTWNSDVTPENNNALVCYDFRNDKIKAFPYNKTETKLYRPSDLTQEWFNTYFKWDTTGTETIIRYDKPEKPVMWQGYFNEDYYHLYPTDDRMLAVFKQFILDYMKWPNDAIISENYHEYTGRVYQLGTDKSIFYLAGKEKEVVFSKDLYEEKSDSIINLVHQIGNAFNEELKAGKYQELFTVIPEFEQY